PLDKSIVLKPLEPSPAQHLSRIVFQELIIQLTIMLNGSKKSNILILSRSNL
ncbi:20093_t:CDS:1, partial [Entrophospora sp. SA101]